jgi:signal transduction histidine kinase
MKLKLTYLFFITYIAVSAQEIRTIDNYTHVIDSLKNIYDTSKNDSVKCLTSLKIAGFYKTNGNDEKYTKYCRLGTKHSLSSPFLIEYSKYYVALKYLNKVEIEIFFEEIKEVQKALRKFNNKESTDLQLIIIQNLSTFYLNNHKYNESIKILTTEGLNLAKKTKSNTLLAMFYENIARSFFNLNQYEKADIYFKKAIKAYLHKTINKDDLALCYVFNANNLIKLNAFDEAYQNLNYVKKHLNQNKKSNTYPHYYYVLGEYYSEKSEHENAIKFYTLGIQNLKSTNNINTELVLKLSLCESLIELNQHNLSYKYLKEIEPKITPFYELSFLKIYSKNLEKLELYKLAYDINQKYIKLKDSVDNLQNKEEFMELEAKYNRIENENKILNLQKENQQKELKLKNNQILYSIFSLLILIGIISFYFLLKNLRNQRKINSQKDIIHNQNVTALKRQKEIEIIQAMIEGEEAERKRIARDLHDGIGSSLSSIKMQLENSTDSKSNIITVVILALSKSIKELRQIAYNLVPETLNRLGLDAAILDLCISNSLKNITVEYNSYELNDKIKPSHQITIYRIVQELVNNALKHSKATLIVVQCSQNNNLFLITVEDNGIGITNDTNKKGLGLSNIKKRVDVLEGKFEICSNNTSGTTVNIELNIEMIL